MIRDPSDGTVRETCSLCGQPASSMGLFECCRPPVPTKATLAKPHQIPSGLPFGSTKPETLARLEKSRAWLKSYREKQKGDENGTDAV